MNGEPGNQGGDEAVGGAGRRGYRALSGSLFGIGLGWMLGSGLYGLVRRELDPVVSGLAFGIVLLLASVIIGMRGRGRERRARHTGRHGSSRR